MFLNFAEPDFAGFSGEMGFHAGYRRGFAAATDVVHKRTPMPHIE